MDPARMFKESLTSRPELENSQGQKRRFGRGRAMSGLAPTTVVLNIASMFAYGPDSDISTQRAF